MYIDQLIDHRHKKDAFFKTNPNSPLTPQERERFTGLEYFPPNESLVLTVDAELLDGTTVELPTTTGDERAYRRYARFTFTVPGPDGAPVECALTIFATPHGYFLPFTDTAKGIYAGGRYLDPHLIEATDTHARFTVDFNMAYSPSCVFDASYSCPLVPAENRLNVAINAGEQRTIFS